MDFREKFRLRARVVMYSIGSVVVLNILLSWSSWNYMESSRSLLDTGRSPIAQIQQRDTNVLMRNFYNNTFGPDAMPYPLLIVIWSLGGAAIGLMIAAVLIKYKEKEETDSSGHQ